MPTRSARRRRRWIARVLALAALLAFWAGLLVLAGLPRWTLVVPAGVVSALIVTAGLPPLARVTLAGARGGFAAVVWALRFVGDALRRTARGGSSLARTGATAGRTGVPRAVQSLLTAVRAGAGASRRALSAGERAARRSAVRRASADRERRRRAGAGLVLRASHVLRAGREQEAIMRCRQALAVLGPAGDGRTEAAALETLALAHVSAGDEAGALGCYERVLALHGSIGDTDAASRVVGNVAALHAWREASDEPVARWRRGLEALERPKQRRRKPPARKRAGG